VASGDDTRAATVRLLDHYVHTGYAAALMLTPGRQRLALPRPARGVTTTAVDSHDDALAWFAAEEPSLTALVMAAAAGGFDGHAWRLAFVAANYLQRRGRWTAMLATGSAALAAARRSGDVHGQVHAHASLARACTWLRRYDEGREHAFRADALCRETDDVTLQAHLCLDLAFVHWQQGAFPEAIQHAQRANALFGVARDRRGTTMALNTLAWNWAQLGEFEASVAAGREAVSQYEELQDVAGEANAWDTLGFAEHGLGHHDRAAECYRRSHELFTAAGDRFGRALALTHLGDVLADGGAAGPSRSAWADALRILDDLGHPDAADVRAKLADRTPG
jgi:tetratricopeptide (TPR) repeat protein